jgi:hypothetical protein
MRILMLCTALMPILTGGCSQCLRGTPLTDATAPDAGLMIRYRDAGGADRSRGMSVGDPDVAITASKNHPFTVEYWGTDLEGLRSAELVYDKWRYSGLQRISPLLLAIDMKSSCPVAALLETRTFASDGLAWRYTFSARATNWRDATAQSGKINVQAQ